MLLVASETGHVYTFATPKLQPFVTLPEGKNLIQSCLNAPGGEGNDAQEGMPQQDNSHLYPGSAEELDQKPEHGFNAPNFEMNHSWSSH